MRSCTAEVTLGAVSVDSNVQASRGSLGIFLAVGLKGIDEGVGGIIGLLELIGLNLRGLFESLSGLQVYSRIMSAPVSERMPRQSGKRHTLLLHLKGIGSLGEEVGGFLVLILSPTEEAEAATGALKLLLSLNVAMRQHKIVAKGQDQAQGGGGVEEPFGGELEGLEP